MVLVAAMLATWLPHYLTWPWWPDADAWAAMAQGWDAGLRPYRDVTCFNFPGQIYESWALGKLFGWGRTWPFYALDAAMLIGLGPVLAIWGRRRFGSALPGLIGWAAAVSAYLNLDYSLVAQRDWQAPLLAVAALATLQSWRGWRGRILSSAMMASAFVIRPHVVVFLPAIAGAVALDADSRRGAARDLAGWGLAFATALLVAFLPLIAGGLVGDFVRGVRQASYGSGYSRTTPGSVLLGVLREIGLAAPAPEVKGWDQTLARIAGWKTLATLTALGVLVATAPRARRASAAPWLAALALVLLYAPLHPKAHGYLALPLRLVWSVAWGLLAGLVLAALPATWGGRRVAVLLVALIVAIPGPPTYCLPGEAIEALRGRDPGHAPATARRRFAPEYGGTPYRWDDYRRLLAYLRQGTTPETRVATVLRNVPFPAVNGAVGRISPLPAESGVIWLWSVDPKLEGAFVAAVDAMPAGSVAVWSPDESTFAEELRLDALRAAIRRGFRPEARFGAFEVWRKPGPP